MAKGRSNNSFNNKGGREDYSFSSRRLPRLNIKSYKRPDRWSPGTRERFKALIKWQNSLKYKQVPSLRDVEDRRSFHPEGQDRAARSLSRFNHRLRIKTPVGTWSSKYQKYQTPWEINYEVPWQIAFDRPNRIAVCIRRKIRSQVLHALGIAGRRGLGVGGIRLNPFSRISC